MTLARLVSITHGRARLMVGRRGETVGDNETAIHTRRSKLTRVICLQVTASFTGSCREYRIPVNDGWHYTPCLALPISLSTSRWDDTTWGVAWNLFSG